MKDNEPKVVSEVESPAQADICTRCHLAFKKSHGGGDVCSVCLLGIPSPAQDAPKRIWIKFYTSDGQYTIFTEPTDYYAIPPIEFVRADLAPSTTADIPWLGMANLYHFITGKDCDEQVALGMATSAVSSLKAEGDRLRASNLELLEVLRDCTGVINDMRSENRLHGHITDANAKYLNTVAPKIETALNNATKVK